MSFFCSPSDSSRSDGCESFQGVENKTTRGKTRGRLLPLGNIDAHAAFFGAKMLPRFETKVI